MEPTGRLTQAAMQATVESDTAAGTPPGGASIPTTYKNHQRAGSSDDGSGISIHSGPDKKHKKAKQVAATKEAKIICSREHGDHELICLSCSSAFTATSPFAGLH